MRLYLKDSSRTDLDIEDVGAIVRLNPDNLVLVAVVQRLRQVRLDTEVVYRCAHFACCVERVVVPVRRICGLCDELASPEAELRG